jgi:hypothetical protein
VPSNAVTAVFVLYCFGFVIVGTGSGLAMNQASHRAFRLSTLLFAVVLGFQSAWLLLAEFSRAEAEWAAEIAGIRGDLWAESAFAYAHSMQGDAGGDVKLARALSSLGRALAYAPLQSSAWLMLAELASRYQLPDIDAKEVLKMSYYTGPSELELMPLRLWIAAHSYPFSDHELLDSFSREVRLLFTHRQNSAVIAAYNAAQPGGKQFIEQIIHKIDPSAVESLRADAKKSYAPN